MILDLPRITLFFCRKSWDTSFRPAGEATSVGVSARTMSVWGTWGEYERASILPPARLGRGGTELPSSASFVCPLTIFRWQDQLHSRSHNPQLYGRYLKDAMVCTRARSLSSGIYSSTCMSERGIGHRAV